MIPLGGRLAPTIISYHTLLYYVIVYWSITLYVKYSLYQNYNPIANIQTTCIYIGCTIEGSFNYEEIATEAVMFSMDITGMGTGTALQNAMASYLNDMYPAATLNTNKVARIHTTSYAGATVQGVDVESAKNVSYVAVDSNGTQNQNVVQDVVFDAGGASGTVILSPSRTLMTYTSTGSAWAYQATTAY